MHNSSISTEKKLWTPKPGQAYLIRPVMNIHDTREKHVVLCVQNSCYL